MQAASPPLWSAHQVIFEFFFSFQKSKTSHFLFDLLIRFTAKMNLFTHWLHLPCPSSLTRSCSRRKWQNCPLAENHSKFLPKCSFFFTCRGKSNLLLNPKINKKLIFGTAESESLSRKVVSSIDLFSLGPSWPLTRHCRWSDLYWHWKVSWQSYQKGKVTKSIKRGNKMKFIGLNSPRSINSVRVCLQRLRGCNNSWASFWSEGQGKKKNKVLSLSATTTTATEG